MTSQNRPPPAFQEYAASMLANNDFRMMSLASRGLLYTLRLEYWLGNPLPADSHQLGKILGFDSSQVSLALQELGGLVTIKDGKLIFGDLDDYRRHLDERRRKQSAGGKVGAEIAKKNKFSRDAYPEPDHQVTQRATSGSLVQNIPTQTSTDQSNSVIQGEDDWVDQYDQSHMYGHKGRTK